MKNQRFFVTTAIFMLAFLFIPNVPVSNAITATWTGAVSSNMSVNGNWAGDQAPSTGDSLVFPEGVGGTINNDIGATFGSVSVEGDSYTFTGNTLDVSSILQVAETADGTTFDDIAFTSGSVVNFIVSGPNTTFNGSINFDLGGVDDVQLYTYDDFTMPATMTGNIRELIITGTGTVHFPEDTPNLAANAISIGNAGVFCEEFDCFGFDTPIDISDTNGYLAISETLNNDITVNLGNSQGAIRSISNSFSAYYAGDITLNTDTVFTAESSSTLTLGATIDVNVGAHTLTLASDGAGTSFHVLGDFTGTGNIDVSSELVRISNATTFAGDITIQDGGRLKPEDPSALGTTGGNTTIEAGGQLYVYEVNNDISIAEPIVVEGTQENPGVITNVIPHATFTGTVTVDGYARFYEQAIVADASLRFENLAGTGTIETESENTGYPIIFTGGSANTFAGDVIHEGGLLELQKDEAILGDLEINASDIDGIVEITSGSTDTIPDDAIVTLVNSLTDTAILRSDSPETIGGIAGVGEVDASEDLTLSVADTTTQTMTGDWTDVGGIIKNRTGTQQITGDVSAISIEVDAGTLTINGNAASADVVTSVDTILMGEGTYSNITAEGDIAPGNSPGVIIAEGDLELSGTYEVEINGTTAGDDYDQLAVYGTATVGSATFALNFGFTPSAGDTFRIVDAGGISGSPAVTIQPSSVQGTLTQEGNELVFTVADVVLDESQEDGQQGEGFEEGETTTEDSTLANTGTNASAGLIAAAIVVLFGATLLVTRQKFLVARANTKN